MNTEINTLIQRIKAMADAEGLSLDNEQTRNLMFLLVELQEWKPLPAGVRYAALDLLGVLDGAEERGA